MTIENLIKAITTGNIEEVKKILEQTENLNVRDYMGISPLHYAVINNKKDIVELLLAKGADINIEDDVMDEKVTKIIPNMVNYRNRSIANRSLIKKEQAEGKTKHTYKLGTPFSYLFFSQYPYLNKKEKLEMAKFLISKGADVNVIHPNDMNAPLIKAVLENDLEMVKLLMENGAFVDYDFIANKPLADALKYGYTELAQYLISTGAF